MFEAIDISCIKSNRLLFKNLSFTAKKHELHHIKGINGAGKTSLLNIICGLSNIFSGKILWCRKPIHIQPEYYSLSSYFCGHKNGLKELLTPIENIQWRSQIRGCKITKKNITNALELADLYGFEHTPCNQLSIGQQKKVVLAEMSISKTMLWILDEPMTSLDTQGIHWLNSVFDKHLASGGIIIATSHQPFLVKKKYYYSIELSNYAQFSIEI